MPHRLRRAAKTLFGGAKQIRALAPYAKTLTRFDTRESIREKFMAHVPNFSYFN